MWTHVKHVLLLVGGCYLLLMHCTLLVCVLLKRRSPREAKAICNNGQFSISDFLPRALVNFNSFWNHWGLASGATGSQNHYKLLHPVFAQFAFKFFTVVASAIVLLLLRALSGSRQAICALLNLLSDPPPPPSIAMILTLS